MYATPKVHHALEAASSVHVLAQLSVQLFSMSHCLSNMSHILSLSCLLHVALRVLHHGITWTTGRHGAGWEAHAGALL